MSSTILAHPAVVMDLSAALGLLGVIGVGMLIGSRVSKAEDQWCTYLPTDPNSPAPAEAEDADPIPSGGRNRDAL